ncbi:family 16 glycosylhydrolase [Falsiroseomonas oryzae]|uniref:family 16 glycosylhydrolase n=1 Tax=Falsiroseomonas oryzae TaxID=2766473 RepID=UPI0022EB35A2|nr:family 16 glycosylhydrolase [Roseomonas sp. MO-31]
MGSFTNTNPTPLDPTGWRLTFEDGFDGVMVDRGAWPIVFHGSRYWNDAFEWRQEALTVWDGELSVNSIATPQGWVAGGLNMGWNGQLYGRFEVRARLDDGQGTSAAILLWPADGEGPAEVDLMESPDRFRTETWMTLHDEPWQQGVRAPGIDAGDWHTYAVDWLPDRLTFYIDGVAQWTMTEHIPDEPMSLGFMGFVASSADGWFGGAPDATTPGLVGLHVDWARIWTPADLHPGEPAPMLFGDPASGWGAAPATVRSGVRSLGEDRYAASWNAGEWGSVTGVHVSAAPEWAPDTADRLLYANYERAWLDLLRAPEALTVQVIGAATGHLYGSAFADEITWVAHADAASGPSTPVVIAGAGNDTVLVTAPSASWLAKPFGWGGRWDGGYDGRLTTALVYGQEGDDRIVGEALVTLAAQGDAGADTLLGADASDWLHGGAGADDLAGGAAGDSFAYAAGEGGDLVRDFTPGLDRIVLLGLDPAAIVAAPTEGGLALSHGGEVLAVLLGVTALQAGDVVLG